MTCTHGMTADGRCPIRCGGEGDGPSLLDRMREQLHAATTEITRLRAEVEQRNVAGLSLIGAMVGLRRELLNVAPSAHALDVARGAVVMIEQALLGRTEARQCYCCTTACNQGCRCFELQA
jgi:hypothetical protein